MWRLAALADAFHGEDDLDHLRGGAEVVVDPEVLQGEAGGALEAATVAAPGIRAGADLLDLDGDGLGGAAEAEITGDGPGSVFIEIDGGARETGVRIAFDVQEVIAAQMLVTLGMVGVQARGLDRPSKGRVGRGSERPRPPASAA